MLPRREARWTNLELSWFEIGASLTWRARSERWFLLQCLSISLQRFNYIAFRCGFVLFSRACNFDTRWWSSFFEFRVLVFSARESGSVLSQLVDREDRVTAYASMRLSRTEVNYCVTRRELLAVVYFLKYFRHHLLRLKFTVRTDHAALSWLRNIPEPVGQQARWFAAMEEYEFSIVRRPGTRHVNADAMSRRPLCQRSRCCPSGGEILDQHVVNQDAEISLRFSARRDYLFVSESQESLWSPGTLGFIQGCTLSLALLPTKAGQTRKTVIVDDWRTFPHNT